MISSQEIHQSVIDADDLEDIREEEISVADVFRSLAHHPGQIIHRWNWKSAMMGAMLRASFYFSVYQASGEGMLVTITAMLLEFSFRIFTSGISGSLVQSFRRASPVWLAIIIVTITLPVFSHTVEYFTHYIQETYFADVFSASQNQGRQRAFAVSVMFSVLSAMFNIYIMRRGVLLVGAGEETKSFLSDMKRIPMLLLGFIAYLPIKIIESFQDRKILNAIGIFLAFGLATGILLGVFRGKWSWAFASAAGAWVLLLVWTIIVGITRLILKKTKTLK